MKDHTGENYRLLICDDEWMIREQLLKCAASVGGFDVYTASSGNDALNLVLHQNIDGIILDIRMPGMDGITFLDQIQKHGISCSVIVLSGHDEFQYAQKCLHYGALEYLLKPISSSQIRKYLEELKADIERKRKYSTGVEIISHLASFLSESDSASRVSTSEHDLTSDHTLDLFHQALDALNDYDRHPDLSVSKPNPAPSEAIVSSPSPDNKTDRISGPDASHGNTQEIPRLVNAAIDELQEHFRDRINIETVALRIGISKNYLSTIFRTYTGYSVNEYLTNLRLDEAKYLLISSSVRIQDIALMAGFSDPFYFSKVFKAKNGISPGEYRESMKT